MPDILIESGRLYLERADHVLVQPLDMPMAQRLFPSLEEKDCPKVVSLIATLKDLVPALGAFVADADNLIEDRGLAATAMSYLIMPFDILREERYGVLGFLDDALVALGLVDAMTAPSTDLVALLATHKEEADNLAISLPDWFTQAVESVVATSRNQHAAYAAHSAQVDCS